MRVVERRAKQKVGGIFDCFGEVILFEEFDDLIRIIIFFMGAC
jgi:hypothetical protein